MICFDVHDKKRLRKVAIQLENIGQRIQYSVFECHLNEKNISDLKQKLEKIIDPNLDHIRFYKICPKDITKVEIDGSGSLKEESSFYMV